MKQQEQQAIQRQLKKNGLVNKKKKNEVYQKNNDNENELKLLKALKKFDYQYHEQVINSKEKNEVNIVEEEVHEMDGEDQLDDGQQSSRRMKAKTLFQEQSIVSKSKQAQQKENEIKKQQALSLQLSPNCNSDKKSSVQRQGVINLSYLPNMYNIDKIFQKQMLLNQMFINQQSYSQSFAEKIQKYFGTPLPSHLQIDENTIYGECKIQTNFYERSYWQESQNIGRNIVKRSRYMQKLLRKAIKDDDFTNNDNRQFSKFIATSTSLLLLKPQNFGVSFLSFLSPTSSKFIQIQYVNVEHFKISYFYSDIFLCYRNKNKQRQRLMKYLPSSQNQGNFTAVFNDDYLYKISKYKEYSVIIESSDEWKLRQYLCKHVSKAKKIAKEDNKNNNHQKQQSGKKSSENKLNGAEYEYLKCPFLGYLQEVHRMYGLPNASQSQYEVANKQQQQQKKRQNKMFTTQDINKTQIINLLAKREEIKERQRKEKEISKQKGEQNSNHHKIQQDAIMFQCQRSVNEMYHVLQKIQTTKDLIQQHALQKQDEIDKHCNTYIVKSSVSQNGKKSKLRSSQKKRKYQDIYTLKAFSIHTLQLNQLALSQLDAQSKLYSEQQLITPYLPSLLRTLIIEDTYIMHYKYYEGESLRVLIKNKKICKQKIGVIKNLLAQIVVALGHVHQCGFVYGRVCLDNVIVNYDGHVLLVCVAEIRKGVINIKQQRKVMNIDQLMQNCEQQYQKEGDGKAEVLKNGNANEKNVLYLTPQSLMKSSQDTVGYPSDWFHLGLLIYQMLSGGKHYYSCYDYDEQKILKALNPANPSQLQLHEMQNILQKQPQLLDLLKKLLTKNERLRLGTSNDYHEILNISYFRNMDKRKLLRRQTEPIIKIKTKKYCDEEINKDIKIQGKINKDQSYHQLDCNNKQTVKLLKQSLFDLTLDVN